MASIPLDEWVEKYCPSLKKDIETHVRVLSSDDTEEQETMVRCIMISVREFMQTYCGLPSE